MITLNTFNKREIDMINITELKTNQPEEGDVTDADTSLEVDKVEC